MAAPASVRMLVASGPSAPELEVLKKLPPSVEVLKVGKRLEDFASLSEEDWESVTVLLVCGVGPNAGKKDEIKEFWPRLRNLKWMHTTFAGLDHLLFPELVDSDVVLTNAKGVYSNSLAEFAIMACKWFAMDGPRLLRAKAARKWEPYDVEELRGRTLGVVGLGDIGKAVAQLASTYKMRVLGLRRSTTLSAEEATFVERIYAPDNICDMVSQCDYVVAATPYTPATHGIVSAAAVNVMRPNCVFVNVGRGKCVDEPALIAALSEGRIKGAALDVFATEPLPEDSPLWGLDNVLMSPHCADITKDFQFDTLDFFIANMGRFLQGLQLWNVCNKWQGY